MSDQSYETLSSYEEEFHGYLIYVERNPDNWRQGLIWSVIDIDKNEVLEDELCFDIKQALDEAKRAVTQIAPDITPNLESDNSHSSTILSN